MRVKIIISDCAPVWFYQEASNATRVTSAPGRENCGTQTWWSFLVCSKTVWGLTAECHWPNKKNKNTSRVSTISLFCWVMKIAFLTATTSFVQTRVTSSLFTQTISDLLCTNSGSASNTEYNTFQSISYIQTITDVHYLPNIGLKFRICCGLGESRIRCSVWCWIRCRWREERRACLCLTNSPACRCLL